MKYLRKFDSVSDMETAIANTEVDFVGLAYNNGTPELNIVVATPPVPDYTKPFYIEDLSGGVNTIEIIKDYSSAPTLAMEKSIDGETWESMGSTSTTAITATIPANGKLYLRCNTVSWHNDWVSKNTIKITNTCNVGGNIMSLTYGSSFTGEQTTFKLGSTYTFADLLRDNTHIISAGNLLLPPTTLVGYCYEMMFSGCTALTTAPELPATTVNTDSYLSMFAGCTSLTKAPSILPITTMGHQSCMNMFRNCTSLTTAPILPAITLYQGCYGSMFRGCTSLTKAPELPATTLVKSCYSSMFQDCINLNYIKCLATDISAENCTTDWVNGVAATGTFVKDPNMSSWTTGNNGIPSGWTV